MKCIFRCVLSNAALASLMLFPEIAPAAILPAPISSSALSEFGGPYVAGALFDGTVADADIGVTVYGVSDNQWAGVGPGPHNLFMDFGATISASGIAYAHRAGAFGWDNDKVGKIELWFSNSDFGSVLPATPAQATVNPSVPSPNNGELLNYPLSSVLPVPYVA